MTTVTPESKELRDLLSAHRDELHAVMSHYGASNLRVFGSVARGDANPSSDIDVLVDLDPSQGRRLSRISGLGEEFRELLGVNVDVIASNMLREQVAESAVNEAVKI